MAVYEYFCPKCRKEFELMRPMSEAGKPAKCPDCGAKAQRLVSGFGSKTGSYLQASEKPFRGKEVAGTPAGKTRAARAPAGKKAKTGRTPAGKARSVRTTRTRKSP